MANGEIQRALANGRPVRHSTLGRTAIKSIARQRERPRNIGAK
jgi:hypothetical protein